MKNNHKKELTTKPVTINLSSIKIPQMYLHTTPSPKKYANHKREYELTKDATKIIINEDNILVDGYITYLIIKNSKYTEDITVSKVSTKETPKTIYVYGKHFNTEIQKEYVWRIPESKRVPLSSIQEGMRAIVGTKNGIGVIYITKVEETDVAPRADIKKVIHIIDLF